jgi:S-formylglutathione hydrolase FrmB
MPTAVLLPPEYATSTRRYPVVYMLPGGSNTQDVYVTDPIFLQQMNQLKDSDQFIVVSPFTGITGFYLNWKDGSHQYETQVIEHLIPAIDRSYRTLADRAHRGIAGVSMGGWGAALYATRHPQLFSVLGTLSGGSNDQDVPTQQFMLGATMVQRHCGDGVPLGKFDTYGMLGNPKTDPTSWQAVNPSSHATSLRGMHIYLTAANGQPCDSADQAAIQHDPTAASVEAATGRGSKALHASLMAARISDTYQPRACGVHTSVHFRQEFRDFIPLAGTWLAG